MPPAPFPLICNGIHTHAPVLYTYSTQFPRWRHDNNDLNQILKAWNHMLPRWKWVAWMCMCVLRHSTICAVQITDHNLNPSADKKNTDPVSVSIPTMLSVCIFHSGFLMTKVLSLSQTECNSDVAAVSVEQYSNVHTHTLALGHIHVHSNWTKKYFPEQSSIFTVISWDLMTSLFSACSDLIWPNSSFLSEQIFISLSGTEVIWK